MAKLPTDEREALLAGFKAEGSNPHYETSTYGELWAFGQYLKVTGRNTTGVEKGRGLTFRTPSGCTFKGSHSKVGLSFERIA